MTNETEVRRPDQLGVAAQGTRPHYRVSLATELGEAARHIRSIEPALELRCYIATRKILRDVIERLGIGDWPGAVLLH